jgi:hypothetical protein
MKSFGASARIAVLLSLSSPAAFSYSVLTHEAVVDAAWDSSIQKLLRARFPAVTPEDLDKAHAYAYGGCIIQDMGYYPFGSHLFSDLTHYVRSGDFVLALLDESQNVDEYAFALGALAHYASDNNGHPIATNQSVPILYPKLKLEFGKTVTYWDNPTAHLRTEFGFDVLQVGAGRYASDQYHKFIGFEVAPAVLERAFQETYGIGLKDVFKNFNLSLGTYRYSVRSVIPGMTRVAWNLKRKQLAKEIPGITRKKFLYNLSRSSYEKDWGKGYQRPGVAVRFVSWIIRIVPKVGPFKSLAFRPPTPEVEKMFMASFNATVENYKTLLGDLEAGHLRLPDRNLDVGDLTRLGAYQGADDAYASLLDKLAGRRFAGLDDKLRSNILIYYANAAAPTHAKSSKAAKKEKEDWNKVMEELMQLQELAASAEPNPAVP